MTRINYNIPLFLSFAIAISMLGVSSAQYLDEIEDDPVQGLFAEAVLQNHLNEKVSTCVGLEI